MLGVIDRWRERRNREWWARWEERHRWTELADYNDRVSKGVVHTPEYVELMREQQAAFNEEQGYPGDTGGVPFLLEPRP